MRICVQGTSTCAVATRGLLIRAGFPVVATPPRAGFTIRVSEHDGPVVFDSVDCELERNILRCVAELTQDDVVVRRAPGDVHSENEIQILVPVAEVKTQECVEIGILRGLLKMFPDPKQIPADPPPPPPPPKPWYKRWFGF